MKIIVLKHAQKDIATLDSRVKSRVKDAITALPAGDIKSLSGHNGLFRLRVGGYRVIFEMDGELVIIRAVLPRGQAYKKL